MKINNNDLGNYTGKTVYFSLEEPRTGFNGDEWREYFTTAKEAVSCADNLRCRQTDRERKTTIIHPCYGVVVGEDDEADVPNWDYIAHLSYLIEDNQSALYDAMKDGYREVLEHRGEIDAQIYISDSGKVHTEYEPQGSSFHNVGGDIYHVKDITCPCFDYRDYLDDDTTGGMDVDFFPPQYPDDGSKWAELRDEIIDYLVDEYNPDDILDELIDDIKRDEIYELDRYC